MKNTFFKTGPKTLTFNANTNIQFRGETDFSLILVDKNDKMLDVLASSKNGLYDMVVTKDFTARINIPKGKHWSLDIIPVPMQEEDSNNTPVEVPEAMKIPLTLEEKLKRMVYDAAEELYGKNSDEMDTLEESLDFGEDDEDDAKLSGYELLEEEIPVELPTKEEKPVKPPTNVSVDKPEVKPQDK